MRSNTQCIYEFGLFRVDVATRRLLREGEPVQLTPKCFDILLALVESSGKVIDKDELIKRVWPDSFVEEGNLTYNISVLRKALGERANEHLYIVTVPGRGYQFVAGVNKAGLDGAQAYLRFGQSEPVSTVAVLPFSNGSGNPDLEYLSEGISENLINSLSQLTGVKVIARSSSFKYKGKEVDPQELARTLGVESILTGRVALLGDNLLISTELIDARDNTQIWGEQYNRKAPDLLSVQLEISSEIARKVRLKLSTTEQRRLTRNETVNPPAYEDAPEGKFHIEKGGTQNRRKPSSMRHVHSGRANVEHRTSALAGLCIMAACLRSQSRISDPDV